MNIAKPSRAAKVNDAYVPAERVFAPAMIIPVLPTINDAFIERVLRVGGMLRDMGDVEGALACYEHFISQLRQFSMVPLGVIVADKPRDTRPGKRSCT